MIFKIGQLVKYDGYVTPVTARVEGREPDGRYRIMVVSPPHRCIVPAGDIALPGEDETNEMREQSRFSWRNVGNLQVTNQEGGFYTKAAGGGSGEPGHELE